MGIFGVLETSSFSAIGSRTLQQAGIPVTGEAIGPEWSSQPYSNMFSWSIPTASPIDGVYYNYDSAGKLFKEIGVTKLAGLAYGISSSAQASAKAALLAASQNGIRSCYTSYSIPYGAVDFMQSNLEKYDPGYKPGTLPDLGLLTSYIEADLMIEGLQFVNASTAGSTVCGSRFSFKL
jgi:hypothetical protein